tara:strand:- start:5889 stop:6071 length:183 start_codon:yes stop_codon:yes gene_type:complete
MTEPVMFDEEDTDYMFTIGQIKSAWKMCYDEDLAEEYSGFVHILKHIIKEREFNDRRNYK